MPISFDSLLIYILIAIVGLLTAELFRLNGRLRRTLLGKNGSDIEDSITTLVKGMLSQGDIRQIGREIQGAKLYVLQKFVSTKILNPQFKHKVSYSDEEMKEFQDMLSVYVDQCHIR